MDKLLCYRPKETAIAFLNGEKENFTISAAFFWKTVADKQDEWDKWDKRNKAFKSWLEYETFENIKKGQLFYYENRRYVKVGENLAFEAKELTMISKTCEVIPL